MKIYDAVIKIIISFLLLSSGNTVVAQDVVQGPSEAFGSAYGEPAVAEVVIEFEIGPDTDPTPVNHLQTDILRDIQISFSAKSGNVAAASNGTKASLNGDELLVTEEFSGDERAFSFIANRNSLIAGTNTITFTPLTPGGTWGVREVTTSYIEAVDIAVGTQGSQQYGYLETPSRFTGLRLDFKAATIFENYTLSVRGWDIDSADETQVYLNGLSLGFLSAGPNNDFNDGDLFILSKNDIVPGGNQIEFVQRIPGTGWEGIEFEQWAVSDLIVSQLQADLIPSNLSVKEEKITENTPFTSLTSVRNVGPVTSSTAVLRYYTSNDSNISRSDTFVIARAIPPIAANTTVVFEKSIQTPLVDRGVYLGVCVSVLQNESDESNNCSPGLLLDNEKANFSPGVLLLLLEE